MKKLANIIPAWEIEVARTFKTKSLKNYIWANIENGQPIPGCITADACRFVLLERGEDGRGYHNT